ncbi:hypothetical protein F5B21DRAFT_319451 [Xylaria acuta]|nr:hypothetical protein F5B21DRAFT_319451 [Xylaria acuta]
MAPSILQLPDTILVNILKRVDTVHCLSRALLAHKCFSNANASCPGIAETIIQRRIHPQLLPLAIANIEASHKTYTRRDLDAVKDLYMGVFENPRRFTDRLKAPNSTNPIPISDLIQIERIDDVIGRIATEYTSEAWRGIMRVRRENKPLTVSETERLRFYRAFYRLKLFFKLCRGDGASDLGFLRSRSFFLLLLHPPWELGQMACVYRRVQRCFVECGKILFAPSIPCNQDGILQKNIGSHIEQELRTYNHTI